MNKTNLKTYETNNALFNEHLSMFDYNKLNDNLHKSNISSDLRSYFKIFFLLVSDFIKV